MALSVTPTSGAAPYKLSIDILNKSLIDGVRYEMEVRSQSAIGECPIPASAPVDLLRTSLLNQGYFIRNQNVAEGSCNVYKVDIIDLATSDIISTQSVSIDNV